MNSSNSHDLYTVTKDSTQNFAKNQSGEKGYNLFLLATNGVKVPKFVVLPAMFFEEFQRLSAIDLTTLNNTADGTRKIIETSMPIAIYEKIANEYAELEKDIISVRSSASSYSALYLSDLDQVMHSIQECWAHAYATNTEASIILQEMINPDVSGVLWTCNPISGKNDQVYITANYGVGQGQKSHHLKTDTIILNKDNGEVHSKNIVEKSRKFIKDENSQAPIEADVDLTEQNAESLKPNNLINLFSLNQKIESLYASPQEVHWALWDDELYILKSKLVSSKIEKSEGALLLWDNSQLSQSFSGLTLPLTFDFANDITHKVYTQFYETMLVPKSRLKEMDYYLKSMLGIFYGRVYSNRFNWNNFISILPGFSADKHLKISTKDKMLSMASIFKFAYFHFNIQNIIDDFSNDFNSVYNKYRAIDYSKLPSDQIFEHYRNLERDIIWKWQAPVINDALYLFHSKTLKKLTSKWLRNSDESFYKDLLTINLEQIDPARELITLATHISRKHELKDLIMRTPNNICMEAINQSPFQEFYHLCLTYLDHYGSRFKSELKLEEKDLCQDPSLLFALLKDLLSSNQVSVLQYENEKKEARKNAEDLLSKQLSGIKKIVYNWSLKHTRKAFINRENTRFSRARFYQITRSMIASIGEDFARLSILNLPEDIYYLSLEELKGSFTGTCSTSNLSDIVAVRKTEYESYKTTHLSSQFTTRGHAYWH